MAAISIPRSRMAPISSQYLATDEVSIGYAPRTIHKGRRQSAARAFLDPVRRRPNLTILTDTTVDPLLAATWNVRLGSPAVSAAEVASE